MIVGVSPTGLQGYYFYQNPDLPPASSPELCRHSCPVQSPGYQHQTLLQKKVCEGVGNETIIGNYTLTVSNCLTTHIMLMWVSHILNTVML